ncbi:arginine ABC transporter substrate-binding protein [Legionella norrlandica]|uniref:Arginine ABC transporter substrate-binding protein n=1 Tax=Legionella norrlandica TaxID=1498499 RepID=A0A0A2T5H0_9GAMM|nr:transporter substrate-binding domain-containing protein [Legionella norrlandica]KGP62693.1 arginine ABC transporter substrate-binding protein [Legionella norrlandica]
MKFIKALLFSFIFFIPSLHAQEIPLIVGIGGFYPPFVMRGANNELFGFDIDMMTELCKIMQRTCRFEILRFQQLIPAVVDKQIDLAVSAMAITSERSRLVNFSIPYLLSYSRFLAYHDASVHQPFSLQLLKGKRVGVEANTVFSQQIRDMGIIDPVIVEFSRTEQMLEALREKEVDFILMDNPSVLYWEANSSGALQAIGPPFLYGYGLGIAVNKENPQLLEAVNRALLQYQSSDLYRKNYNKYLMEL